MNKLVHALTLISLGLFVMYVKDFYYVLYADMITVVVNIIVFIVSMIFYLLLFGLFHHSFTEKLRTSRAMFVIALFAYMMLVGTVMLEDPIIMNTTVNNRELSANFELLNHLQKKTIKEACIVIEDGISKPWTQECIETGATKFCMAHKQFAFGMLTSIPITFTAGWFVGLMLSTQFDKKKIK